MEITGAQKLSGPLYVAPTFLRTWVQIVQPVNLVRIQHKVGLGSDSNW
jgi:hypothetical protein